MNMFYSQCLLSKKGPLRNIWIAAHFHNKLKKEQVKHTDISSSVDKILADEVPVVTYRILGYLLLGIVRIYSKKVEYLVHDFRHVLTEISGFPLKSKKVTAATPMEVMGFPHYSSITLPQTFELDAFDLQVPNHESCEHVKSREELILEGKNEEMGTHKFGARFEDYSAHTNITHTQSLYLMNDDTIIQDSHNLSNIKPSVEKLRDYRFSLEDRFDPMILDEPDEEQDITRLIDEINKTNGKEINSSGYKEIYGDDPNQTNISGMTSLENEKNIPSTSEKRPVSIAVDVTPESKVPNASGATSPDFIAVRTPATKDRSRVSKKRKIIFDDIIVIPNKVFKQGLNDSSDLICKRKKAPFTALQSQKTRQITNLPQSFFEPLIPSIFSDHRNIISQKKIDSPEPVETVETNSKADEFESPIHKSPEPEAIAPSTPITQSTSLRYSEMRSSNIFDKEGPSMSFESTDKEIFPSDSQDFDLSYINEELSSSEGDSGENHKWSVKTRSVANYLHRNFISRKKKREDKALNLSQVLKGKTKKESARLFYEILVLKNGGYIDVKQENAYDEIIVVETHKLKKACEADDDGS